ncbi:alpha/beta hydrolase [Caulobacter sp. KR2-114]|uniref:alpha/beta hydrolase n=1 Tax=Caulobacter sp. KR2-114 TaxID=3400912 RepID=UPI003C00AA75
MKLRLYPLIALCLMATMATAAPMDDHPAGPDHRVIALWPGPPPGAPATLPSENVVERPGPLRDRYVEHVARPRLVVFEPAHPTGASLLMAPGGGYRWVVMDKEGYEAAERFAAAGLTVYVLSYRLPGDGWAAGPATPLQDAQRALRLIRQRAGPDARVGVIGFSAGGHVAGTLALKFDAAVYAPLDSADGLSARPDFAILMYPVATMLSCYVHEGSRRELLGPAPTQAAERDWSLQHMARPDAPPVLIMHALDDASVPVENSLQLLSALRAAHVPAEAHLFEEGGHGFGIRYAVGKPAALWPDIALAWLRRKGFAR